MSRRARCFVRYNYAAREEKSTGSGHASVQRATTGWSVDTIVWVSALASAAVVHTCIAPLRRLTFDEAYYLTGARAGIPWPIHDHPPVLGVLLALAELMPGGNIELRTRAVAIVMHGVMALGVGRLASLVAPARSSSRAFAIGVVLATWGLMPTACGLLTIPEVPLLAILTWLLCTVTEHTQNPKSSRFALVTMFVLSMLAVATKVSALVCIAGIAFEGVVARRRPRALGSSFVIVAGALAAIPVAWWSLVGQSAHALGHGAFVSQPRSGVVVAVTAISVAVVIVFSPCTLFVGARAPELAKIVGGRSTAILLTAALLASALISGRLPEVHWFAPASVPLFAAAAAALTRTSMRVRMRVLAAHVVPAWRAVYRPE